MMCLTKQLSTPKVKTTKPQEPIELTYRIRFFSRYKMPRKRIRFRRFMRSKYRTATPASNHSEFVFYNSRLEQYIVHCQNRIVSAPRFTTDHMIYSIIKIQTLNQLVANVNNMNIMNYPHALFENRTRPTIDSRHDGIKPLRAEICQNNILKLNNKLKQSVTIYHQIVYQLCLLKKFVQFTYLDVRCANRSLKLINF